MNHRCSGVCLSEALSLSICILVYNNIFPFPPVSFETLPFFSIFLVSDSFRTFGVLELGSGIFFSDRDISQSKSSSSHLSKTIGPRCE